MGEKSETEKLWEKVDEFRIQIADLDKRILEIETKNKISDQEIQELKKYKDIVIELKKDIKTILDQIADIKEVAASRSKTSLTIAIAILSPILTALIAFFFYWWFYRPAQQLPQPTPIIITNTVKP